MTTMMTTTNSRWKVEAQVDRDSIRLIVSEKERVLGVLTMPIKSYRFAARDLIVTLTSIAQKVISETLAKRLWADAQSQTMGLDADAAKEKLENFGWSQGKVDQYAEEMAITLSQHLVELLPKGNT